MVDRPRRLVRVSAGNGTVVACVDGEGPTLVMLPSFGRDSLRDFDPIVDHVVARGWRVLRPQPRGTAGSVGSMQGVDLKELAGDVALTLHHFVAGPAVILGHAFGSFIARVLMVERPDLVRGVVLAAASTAPDRVAPEINETPFVAGDPTRPEDERLAALRLGFFAPGHDPRSWLDGWYPEALAMQRNAVQATALDPYWFGGVAPILEINARWDPFKPEKLWSELCDEIGERATTVMIDHASHALFPEQPQPVAEAVGQWLARL